MNKKDRLLVILLFVFSIFVSSGISVYATSTYLYNSSDVSYNNTNSKLVSANVQDALDELYMHSTDYTEINNRITELESRSIGCTAYKNNNEQSGTGSYKVNLDTLSCSSTSFSLSDGGLVMPKTGYVVISASIMLSDNLKDKYLGLIIKNGTTTISDSYGPTFYGNYGVIAMNARVMKVTSGDILYLYTTYSMTSSMKIKNSQRTNITIVYI